MRSIPIPNHGFIIQLDEHERFSYRSSRYKRPLTVTRVEVTPTAVALWYQNRKGQDKSLARTVTEIDRLPAPVVTEVERLRNETPPA